jgi:hypothetical protein
MPVSGPSSVLDPAFAAELAPEKLWTARLGCGMAALLYLLFGIIDLWMIPSALHAVWTIRAAVITASLVVLALTRTERFLREYEKFALFMPVLWAAGIEAFDSTILNSTVSGNSIWTFSLPAAGGILASGTMIVGSTISANTFWTNREEQDSAAGLLAASGESTTLAGTILAGNLSDTGPGDCGGAVASGGWNLVGDPAGCDFVATAADLVGVDPRLGPLADNGGPTLTHALLPGSPAIDAFACRWGARRLTVLPVDQRGVRRPQDGDGDGRSRCDIGSVEMRGR